MANAVRTVGPPMAPNDRGFPPTAWHQVDWRKAERTVQSLRFRIFRATQEQRWKQVRNLTKLLLRSYANVLVSVRRVTQVNRGKPTPGINGELATTPDERARLVDDLRRCAHAAAGGGGGPEARGGRGGAQMPLVFPICRKP